ncbi:WG repeat-containing protein [Flavobacterium sp. CF136]|uniref:WG repeat-containing protein n=1 Tax=Flavobacterium sp. (strain CF136) TaxID=1144313 RepID=UPI0002715276|nr:WG repeat-containing protein [Flavobacterium sp. CF136]EJL65264.1 KWG repeat protein [Flavobacterium sp. CF136]
MKYSILLFLIGFYSVAFAQKEKKYLAQVNLDGKYGFIDASGHEVIPLIYDDAGIWGNNLVPVNIGKYTPKIDPPSIEVAEPDVIQAENSVESDNEKIVPIKIKEEKGKWGYCNSSGTLVIPAQFTNTTFFNEGMAGVEIDGKWGFINTQGKIVVQPVYDEIGYFSQGLAAVAKNGSYGYINLKGEEVIKLQYIGAKAFENGYALVYENHPSKNNNRTSIGRLINLKGEMVTDAKYCIDIVFLNGLASFLLADSENSLYGLINMKGQIVAPPIYFEILDFSDGLARVMVYKRDKIYNEYTPNFGYIDSKGKEIVKPVFATAESFNYGKAVIARFDDKDDGELDHALINTKGEFILGFNWRQLILIDNQHLLASIKNKYETLLINSQGKKIQSFGDNGLATLGNGLSVITNTNDEPIAFIGVDKKISIDLSKSKNRKFVSYQFGLIRFQYLSSNYEESRNIKLGLLDLKDNVIIEPKYNEISDFVPTVRP